MRDPFNDKATTVHTSDLLSLYKGRLKKLITANKMRGKHVVHFLHIGKTGGTAVKHALEAHLITPHYIIKLHDHRVKLRDVPNGEKVIFFIRDPITRFVSGFYSRKRQGAPRYCSPWSPNEKVAFEQFSTPKSLATALSAESKEMQNSAVSAMRSIAHVNSSYWDWFENEAYFNSRLGDIFYIGFQESLHEDFAVLKSVMKLPRAVKLPEGDLEAHRNARDVDRDLGEEAMRNLEGWYARDYDFVKLCGEDAKQIKRELRKQWVAEDGQELYD